MKITDLSVTLFAWDDIPQTRYGQHTGQFSGSSQLGLVRLHTDAGVDGYAFLGSSSRSAQMDVQSLLHYLKPIVVGADPFERERLYAAMYRKMRMTTLRAIGAVDIALWDIAGKVTGLPIAKLIGQYRHTCPAYASSAVMTTPQEYVQEALRLKGEGWSAYKIHPPTEPELDIAVCAAVREAVGGAFPLMLDATWSYDYPQALRVGRAIQEMNYYWYEDPLDEEDLLNYVKLKQQLYIPIVATEYSPGGLYSYPQWLMHQATDYLRGDVAVKGGITGILKAAHLAEAFKMNYEIHHGGNSLNNVANLHVTMALSNCEFFEVLLPSAAQEYGLENDIQVDADGLVHAINEPGLGVAIDFDLIEAKKVAVL